MRVLVINPKDGPRGIFERRLLRNGHTVTSNGTVSDAIHRHISRGHVFDAIVVSSSANEEETRPDLGLLKEAIEPLEPKPVVIATVGKAFSGAEFPGWMLLPKHNQDHTVAHALARCK